MNCKFFNQGTIIRNVFDQSSYVCIGHIGDLIVLAWKLEMLELMGGPPRDRKKKMAFVVGTDGVDNAQALLINPLAMDGFDAVPSRIVSPLHLWLANTKKVHSKSGVVFLRDGEVMTLMELAAHNCFYITYP